MLGTHNSGITLADGYGTLDPYFQKYFEWIKWAVSALVREAQPQCPPQTPLQTRNLILPPPRRGMTGRICSSCRRVCT